MILAALRFEEMDIAPLESNDILMFRLEGVPQVFIPIDMQLKQHKEQIQ